MKVMYDVKLAPDQICPACGGKVILVTDTRGTRATQYYACEKNNHKLQGVIFVDLGPARLKMLPKQSAIPEAPATKQ